MGNDDTQQASTPRRRQLRQKRYLDSPVTPLRPRKRQMRAYSSLPRRISFTDESSRPGLWSEAEVKALVEFVLSHSSEDCWPTHQQVVFWNSAATFVKKRTNTSQMRSGECAAILYSAFSN